jgi:lysophospholipase L1-like esterase
VILMPTKEEVYRHLTEPYLGAAYLDQLAAPRLRLLTFCAAERLTCLDLTPALSARAQQDQQLFFGDDIHLNALGNRAVAEIVADFLAQD